MTAPPPDPDEDDTGVGHRYDAILARHLQSKPQCRLFVGADLARVHWPGVNHAFGPLLAVHPDASVLAVYDDSSLGRGRYGFVVTDQYLHYVQRSGSGDIPLTAVRRVSGIPDGLRVTIGLGGRRTSHVDLRVDEWEAMQSVQGWLEALVSVNRTAPVPAVPTAAQALDRLESLAARGTLRPSHIERIVALAERVRPRRT